MYTLRIIDESRQNTNAPFEQVIENHALGISYAVVRNGISSEFDAILNGYPHSDRDKIAAFLCTDISNEYGNVFFILKNTDLHRFDYYIMTDSGKTFEKISN